MSQIAQYRERRFGTRRDFVLLDDAVSVRGKTFLLSEFDSTIPLQALVPTTSRAKIRSPNLPRRSCILSICRNPCKHVLGRSRAKAEPAHLCPRVPPDSG